MGFLKPDMNGISLRKIFGQDMNGIAELQAFSLFNNLSSPSLVMYFLESAITYLVSSMWNLIFVVAMTFLVHYIPFSDSVDGMINLGQSTREGLVAITFIGTYCGCLFCTVLWHLLRPLNLYSSPLTISVISKNVNREILRLQPHTKINRLQGIKDNTIKNSPLE